MVPAGAARRASRGLHELCAATADGSHALCVRCLLGPDHPDFRTAVLALRSTIRVEGG